MINKETNLFIVGTPIGNLGDISKRAVETLQTCDIIFAEDTRTALALLNSLGIKKPIESYHKDNEALSAQKIIAKIADGKKVAIVSEAGMPCISDPGAVIVKLAIENNIRFEIIQGATALIHAIIASGFSGGAFYFYGFLPHKTQDKKKEIEKLKNINAPIILYESPYRVKETLEMLIENDFALPIAVSREMTKMYEETIFINSKEDIEKITIKGEFAIVINNLKEQPQNNENAPKIDYDELAKAMKIEGISQKDAVKVLKILGMKRNDAYKITSE